MAYLVIIADIIGSRQLTNRARVQELLADKLEHLNADRSQLASPYTITLGDEFQAVLNGADRLFPDIFTVMHALHPVELRFAIAIDALDTPIDPKQAIGMDGPAFHLARELLEQMKRDDRILALGGLADKDRLVEAALGLFSHQLRKWRPNRLEVLRLRLRGWEVAAIAEHLAITEQSVYKNIREGGLEPAIQLIQALTQRLNHAIDDTA